MKHQLTVRISEDLHGALSLVSQRLRMTPSEIVRLALDQFLAYPDSDRRPAERVGDLIGSLNSGVSELAEKHREYVLDSLRDGR